MTTVEEEESPPIDPPRRSFSLVRTQRTLQIILGLFWLLDAGLQFQPYMFSSNFTSTYLLNNAHNQPDIVRWIITNVGDFVGPHVAVWNTFFALIQVAIGLGLLFRRTVRPALVVSFLWVFGVWFFGEGLGQVFTGSASALTGAPGSVLLYGLIGLMAWPRSAPAEEHANAEPKVGIASSAAAQGIGGAATPLLVWSGYWSLAAVLFLLPDNRTPTSVSSAITGMSSGEPSVYSHFLEQLRQPFRQWRRLDDVAARHRLARGRIRTPGLPPTDSVPRRRRRLVDVLLGQRSGPRRHLHRLGDRPELWAPRRAPGVGHGAGRAPGSGDVALPDFDCAV